MKVCILSEYAYSFFSGRSKEVGGAELQMVVLAKELTDRKHDVSFVTFEESKSSHEIIQGIKTYNPFDTKGSGYSYLLPHNIYKLIKILNKINADIYIQRATSPLTGFISLYTKLKNKKFIYSVSSELDVSDNLKIRSIKDLKNIFYKFGVKYSDCVVCQTNNQINLLNKSLNKKGKLIKNLYPLPKEDLKQNNGSDLKILWVGRLVKEKRPDLFLKLAKMFPELKFWMIGGCPFLDQKFYKKIEQSANEINNVEFLGYVPHEEIDRYYKESSILVSTSLGEGFPNIFLEAWGNYTPVVSLNFDPDGLISNQKLGITSKSFEQLKNDIKTLINNDKLRKEMGNNSRRYVEQEHNVKKIVAKYEKLIESLVNGG